jgi:hypothetical protein
MLLQYLLSLLNKICVNASQLLPKEGGAKLIKIIKFVNAINNTIILKLI